MRSGEHYRKSLSDGRHVVIDGEVVKDMASHPAFRGVVETTAKLYDLAAAKPEEFGFVSTETGKAVPVCHLIPRSQADLATRRKGMAKNAEATFGLLGRGPDHVGSFFAGFASAAPEVFGKFGENVVRFQKKMQDENLFAAYTIIPPQIDRSKTASEQEEKHFAGGGLQGSERGDCDSRGADAGDGGADCGLFVFELHSAVEGGG